MSTLRKGDIIAFKPKGLGWLFYPYSWLIKQAQGCSFTHVGLLVEPELMVMVEAHYPVARLAIVQHHRWREWAAYRPKGLGEEAGINAAREALNLVGTPYDWEGVFSFAKWLLIERLWGTLVRDRIDHRDAKGKLFCSELVTAAYELAGYRFAGRLGFKDPSAITPSDIARRTDAFDLVGLSP